MRFAFTCVEAELEEKIKKVIADRMDKYVYQSKTIKHTPGDNVILVEMVFVPKKKEILHD